MRPDEAPAAVARALVLEVAAIVATWSGARDLAMMLRAVAADFPETAAERARALLLGYRLPTWPRDSLDGWGRLPRDLRAALTATSSPTTTAPVAPMKERPTMTTSRPTEERDDREPIYEEPHDPGTGEVPRGAAPLARRRDDAPMARREPEPAAEITAQMPVRQSRDSACLEMALAMAWLEFPAVKKGKTAEVTKGTMSYSYGYASLPDVMREVTPALRKHQLAPTFTPTRGHVVLRIFHVPSGQWKEGDLPMPPTDARLGVQAIGGALTYQMRRLICAMLGVVLEDDDDGALATAAAKMPDGLRDDARALAVEPGGRIELLARMKRSRIAADVQRAALAIFDEVVAERTGTAA